MLAMSLIEQPPEDPKPGPLDLTEDLHDLDFLTGHDQVSSALHKIRLITEKVLHQLCTARGVSWGDAEPTLERMLGPLVAARALPRQVATHVRAIQSYTSPGSHFQETPFTEAHLSVARTALDHFLKWHQAPGKRRPAPTPSIAEPAPAAPPAPLPNPFEFDTTATGKTFRGREVEIGELLDSIRTGTHTAIFGLQRMGKTSLIEEGLKKAFEQDPALGKSVLPVRIDLQGLGGDQVKYRDLVHAIVEAIAAKLPAVGVGRAVQDVRALTNELFAANRCQRGDRTQFFAMFARLLRGFASAAHRRIVLFIDEFSEIRKVIERNKSALLHNPQRTANLLPHDLYLDVPFVHHLGSLLKDRELKAKFTLIVLVRPFMAEYDDREGLQILKLMKPITLYYLEEEAARALVTEPLEGQVAFEAGTVDYLCRLTAGHPYLLQFLLKMLVDRINREGRRTLTLDDVRRAEERMVSEGPAYDAQFAVLISDYSVAEVMHPKEALLGEGALALIAKLGQAQPEGWVFEEQVVQELARHKIPAEKSASLLSQLTRTKILEGTTRDGALCYRLAVPLVGKRFVRQNLHLKYFH
jgi:hypothetical protein